MAKQRKSSIRGQSGANIHGHGSITRGPVTEDMVENRARELAFIDGRNPNRVTTSDRIQAKKELLGDASGDNAVDDTGITPSGMGSPPVSRGHKIEPQLPTDDEIEIQTVQEGLDEAEHDEMLQAAKTRPKNEG
jgi:hypothetical protein